MWALQEPGGGEREKGRASSTQRQMGLNIPTSGRLESTPSPRHLSLHHSGSETPHTLLSAVGQKFLPLVTIRAWHL